MIFFHLAQVLFVAGVAVVAALLIVHGRRRQRPRLSAVGMALGGLLVALIVYVASRPDVDEWNLTLVDTIGRKSEAWRAVVADREYRIIREVGDPDVWGGDLGYRRAP